MSTYFKKGSVGAVIIALIALILFGFAVWYINARKNVTPPQTVQGSWERIQSPAGYELSYPSTLTRKDNVTLVELATAPTGTTLQFKNTYEKSTVGDARIGVVAVSETCSALVAEGERTTNQETKVLNGKTFTVGQWGDAAAGSVYSTDAYYIYENGTCYMLTLLIRIGNPGNYVATPQEIEQYNTRNKEVVAELKQVFDSVASTFVITTPTQTSIKIPLLVDSGNSRFEGQSAGCDKVVMVERTVPYTPQVLNAVYKELFAKKEKWPYSDTEPGNFITSRTKLFFDRAEIQNGVAKVYVTGEIGSYAGVCDDPRLKSVLTAAAKQFPSVSTVEFYLNNKKVSLETSGKGE